MYIDTECDYMQGVKMMLIWPCKLQPKQFHYRLALAWLFHDLHNEKTFNVRKLKQAHTQTNKLGVKSHEPRTHTHKYYHTLHMPLPNNYTHELTNKQWLLYAYNFFFYYPVNNNCSIISIFIWNDVTSPQDDDVPCYLSYIVRASGGGGYVSWCSRWKDKIMVVIMILLIMIKKSYNHK